MRRSLAPVTVAAALLLRAFPAFADPNDLELQKLGAPDPAVRTLLGQDPALAAVSKQNFALLASELGLALSSFILSPAETTGYAGFDFGLEAGYAPVRFNQVRAADGTSIQNDWPTRGSHPRDLLLPAFHVRKSLPYSFEIGGRVIYLNQSTVLATQGEVKWALNEGYRYVPDLAVRGAVTHLFSVADLSLTTLDLDLMVSKRFAVLGVMSLTPYAALRWTWLDASSDPMDFGAAAPGTTAPDTRDPATLLAEQARFPELRMHDHRFTRYALGVRMITYAVSMALEVTYFDGNSFRATSDYPAYTVHPSLSGGFRFGFEF